MSQGFLVLIPASSGSVEIIKNILSVSEILFQRPFSSLLWCKIIQWDLPVIFIILTSYYYTSLVAFPFLSIAVMFHAQATV